MNQALIIGAAVFFGLAAFALWADYLRSRKAKRKNRENREVGYRRPDIQIDPRAVPEFKPTWRDVRDRS
jgi:hypothetical protein